MEGPVPSTGRKIEHKGNVMEISISQRKSTTGKLPPPKVQYEYQYWTKGEAVRKLSCKQQIGQCRSVIVNQLDSGVCLP
jgi:hypothetical protein